MNGRFHTKLYTEVVYGNDNLNILLAPLVYETDVLYDIPGSLITVPAGFETDFATVPRLPFAYWLTGGCARHAAVVHDYLLTQGFKRARADAVFMEAMTDSGVKSWRKGLMFAAVRGYGMTQKDSEFAE